MVSEQKQPSVGHLHHFVAVFYGQVAALLPVVVYFILEISVADEAVGGGAKSGIFHSSTAERERGQGGGSEVDESTATHAVSFGGRYTLPHQDTSGPSCISLILPLNFTS